MIVKTLNIMLVYDKYRMALFWSSFLWPSPRYRVRPLRKACVVGKQGTAECLALCSDPRISGGGTGSSGIRFVVV